MITPNILIAALPARTETFIEYQSNNRSSHAYVFPCDDEGAVNVENLSATAQKQFLLITDNLHQYRKNGIVHLQVPCQPMVIICKCKTIITFSTEQTTSMRCSNCGHFWRREQALALPLAPKVDLQ